MASLYKRDGRYCAQFGSGENKRRFSLGTTRKDAAQKLLRKLEAAQEALEWDPLTEHPDKILKPQAAPREAEKPPVPKSLEERVAAFLHARRHLKGKTLKSYRQVLALLVKRGGSLDAMMEGVATTTQHKHRRHLSTFYRWQIEQGWLDHNPCKRLVLQREPDEKPEFFTREDIDHLVGYIREHARTALSEWLCPMIVFACYTGLRLDELRNLRWCQIAPKRGPNGRAGAVYIHFRAGETKSGREEEVFIPRQARAALDAVPRKYGDYVFQPMNYYNLSHLFTDWRKKAGLARGSMHTLRHTCASWMAMAGTSPLVIKKHLRHSSLKVTERYMHLAPSSLEEQVGKAFVAS